MATYGGVNLFGTGVSFATTDRARESQLNAYFGIGGIESLDGGSRGRITNVSGVLFAPSAAALASTEAAFRGYVDGIDRDLVDDLGSRWSNVLLESFQPQGRIRRTPDGLYFHPYRARFLHLT
jgi:hypothetical protein